MTDKEKLVELLDNSFEKQYGKRGLLTAHHTAEDLIANGVTIQEHDGCVYCKDSESVYHHGSEIHDSMDEDVYISGNSIVVDIGCHSYGTAEIRFCPMCGRKLSEPPKGE